MSQQSSGVLPDERRGSPRTPASGRAKLVFAPRRPALDVEIVDRSMTGLRVRLEEDMPVSGEVTLLSAATGQVYEARVVWKAFPHMGLSIKKIVDMRNAQGADAAALRKLWLDAFGR